MCPTNPNRAPTVKSEALHCVTLTLTFYRSLGPRSGCVPPILSVGIQRPLNSSAADWCTSRAATKGGDVTTKRPDKDQKKEGNGAVPSEPPLGLCADSSPEHRHENVGQLRKIHILKVWNRLHLDLNRF